MATAVSCYLSGTASDREQALRQFERIRDGDVYSHALSKDQVAAADAWDEASKEENLMSAANSLVPGLDRMFARLGRKAIQAIEE